MKNILLTFLLFICMASRANAVTTVLVAKTGNNANACPSVGQTSSAAKLTIAAGIACVPNSLGAGANYIVEVAAGTYAESLEYTGTPFPSGTSWSSPFIFRAKAGDAVTVKTNSGANLVISFGPLGGVADSNGDSHISFFSIIQGFTFDGTNNGVGEAPTNVNSAGNDIRFIGNSFINSSGYPFGVAQGYRLEFLNNKIHDGNMDCSGGTGGNWCYPVYSLGHDGLYDGNELYNFPTFGFHLYDHGKPTGNTVRNNYIHDFGFGAGDNRGQGILTDGTNHIVYNNVIANGTRCISLGGDTQVAFSNTCYNMSVVGITYGNNVTVENNINYNVSASSGDWLCALGSCTGLTFATNLCTATSASNGCSVVGNPRLVDSANGDFRLCIGSGSPTGNCSTASPAIDAGTTLGFPYDKDKNGTQRPIGSGYDIGAYEADTGTPPPTCPSTPALVASYGFEGNGTDSSGNSNTATVTSGLTYTTGKYGQGVLFDGSHAITIAHSSSLYLCRSWTISLSVKLPSGLTDFVALVTSNYNSQDGWFLYAGSSGYAQAGAPIGGYCIAGCSGSNSIAVYGTNLASGSFVDVALTYDSTLPSNNMKLWVGQVNVTAANGTTLLQDWTGNVTVGGSPFGEFLPSGSVVDELRLYNYARTQAQQQTDANTPIVATNPSVVLTWGASSSAVKFGAGSAVFKARGQ